MSRKNKRQPEIKVAAGPMLCAEPDCKAPAMVFIRGDRAKLDAHCFPCRRQKMIDGFNDAWRVRYEQTVSVGRRFGIKFAK